MITKFKLALATAALVIGSAAGFAAAQGPTPTGKVDFAARKQEKLQKYDTNKDGKLDAAERQVMKDERAAAQFKKLDKNNDGVLSLDEFKAQRSRMGRGGKFGRGMRGRDGTSRGRGGQDKRSDRGGGSDE